MNLSIMSAKFITINKEQANHLIAQETPPISETKNAKRIAIDSKVKLRDLVGTNIVAFQITAHASDNYEQQIISAQSPLALAVLGAYEGDIVGFQTKAGYRKFLVIDVG